MPINPAKTQSVRYKYPTEQPNMAQLFALMANSFLKGYMGRKAEEQNFQQQLQLEAFKNISW